MKRKLPEKVYITIDTYNKDKLVMTEDAKTVATIEGQIVGVYGLKETKRISLKVTEEVVEES